ncbi:MAG TPA: VWA domain-containing protein, partial [Thermoanaerobaculia bacterium]|nr:VWA domain-containing protein [Thermoanaerobaculia bacterium]
PAGANAEDERLAVVVDEPAGGAWGGELAAVVTAAGAEEGASLLPAPPAPGTAAPAGRPARPPAGGPVSGPRVRILRPAAGKAAGLVDVEAEVRVPAENRVARVEFFWNDELAATLYQPPFRHRVPVPAGRPGYLRVAAHLDDGSIAEDAVPLNTAELGERLDVQLVQLYVVVTDHTGRPVRGLAKGDFQVLQDGRAQRLASFDDAADLPLTLGLAIDSSASMFLKLPDVVAAARSLLARGLGRRDSALLVDFSTHPRLVAPATHDLQALSSALDTLRPDGDTGLWQAIDFSLAELQRVSGRKALVLYSDGLEQNDSFPYRSALKRARESGIPLYLIVTDAQAARTGNVLYLGRSYAARLDRLASAAGGKIYFVRPDQDLAAVYREILAELRSQYVLSYYPKDPATDAWRKVKVEVAKKGLTARTLSGYYAGR